MEIHPILDRFDEETRIEPAPERGIRFEAGGGVVRAVGHYACICYSKLSEANADGAVADQVAYFTSLGQEVEWKVYGHDEPRDLGARLAAHGFEAGETETVMVFDLARDLQSGTPDLPLEIRRVRDEAGLDDLIAVRSEAFGGDTRMTDLLQARLGDPSLGLFVAYADGAPVAAGRLEMPPSRSFAGLWGGGTVPAFRGRGVYRALVGERAREAKRLGYRYLHTDARHTSRPILEQLGFVPLTTVTGWVLRPPQAEGSVK